MPDHNQIWDSYDLDQIAELWAEGLTTTVIGQRLKIPKNSVCRLARNARLSGDPRFPMRVGLGPPKKKADGGSARRGSVKLLALPPDPSPARSRTPSMAARRLENRHPRIYELRPNECRYPVIAEGRDHRFCAAPQRPGSSYCGKHADLCRGALRGAGQPRFTLPRRA